MLEGKFNITVDGVDFCIGHSTLYSSDVNGQLTEAEDNSLRRAEVNYFIENFIYEPTEILFGIVSPSCNLKCKDCIKQLSDNYNSIKTTTPSALDSVLSTASKLNKIINISFANNEIFSPNLHSYQKDLISVLKKYKIGFHVVHTNGVHLDSSYPLTEYLLEENYEVVLGANITDTESGEHLNLSSIIPSLERLLQSGIKNISINALYDLEKNIDIDLFREFVGFTKCNNVKIKLSVVYKKTPKYTNPHLATLLEELPLKALAVQSKEPSLYALFKGEIPIAPVDGFSNFFVVDENTIALMSIDKIYKFRSEEDLISVIRDAFTDLYLTNNTDLECSKCPLYFGCFQANRDLRLCEYEKINAETLLALRCKEASICNSILGQSCIGILNQIINTEHTSRHFWNQFRRRH